MTSWFTQEGSRYDNMGLESGLEPKKITLIGELMIRKHGCR